MVFDVLVQVTRSRVLFAASRTLVLFLFGVHDKMTIVQRLTGKELATVRTIYRNRTSLKL